jgi:hypothetical protein
MKQSTTNNNKNENMKMRKKLITALVLGACVSTQVFAQVKEDVITFSLTGQKQNSVSHSATVDNQGTWSGLGDANGTGPRFYKTATTKVTDQDIIKFIAYVKHHNALYYSTKAKLVLVQGELSGFFNITPELGGSIPQNETYNMTSTNYLDGIIDDGSGNGHTADFDPQTDIPNSTDSAFVTLANGHHMLLNNTDPVNFTGNDLYPVGHNQPWGQIFIKDTGKSGYSVLDPLCENVTYYFAFSVEECYDCFYMNSFVSDATFTISQPGQAGPPCCGALSTLIGHGKDRYYLTLSFDNTANNPYLNTDSDFWVGNDGSSDDIGIGPNYPAPNGSPIPGDGLVPDQVNTPQPAPAGNTKAYQDTIRRNPPFINLPYEARFTLNGILTYTWNLKFLNKSDAAPDFIGTGSFAASGYGFVALYCQLFTGSTTFTESLVKTACCLDNGPWFDTYGGWYGPGAEYYDVTDDAGNIITDNTKYSLGDYDVPGATPSGLAGPINTGVSLTYHHNFDLNYGWAQNTWGSGWPTPAVIEPNGTSAVSHNIGWADFDIGQPAGYHDYNP